VAVRSSEGLGITVPRGSRCLSLARAWRLNYGRAGANAPTRHSQVSCYTSRSMMTTKTLPSLMICSKVKLTTNVSLNMVLSFHGRRALAGQTLTVGWAFAGSYERRFGTPAVPVLLAAGPWSSYFHGAPPAAGLQALADIAPPRGCGRGCEAGFVHTRRTAGAAFVMPNV